jgi:ATP-binding cassette subfamily B protein
MATEVLNAIAVVQSYTAEQRETERFSRASDVAFEVATRRSRARSMLVAFIIIATSAALLWGLYQGAQAVLAGRISAGHLGQTVVYVLILAGAFAVLGEVYGDLLRAAGATERLMELLQQQATVVSPVNPTLAHIGRSGSAIYFDRVDFHYPSRKGQAALHNFTLAVAPGETVALVGPSGAGKSTVFQLLLRFYDSQSGRILIDGTPSRELALSDLRQRIGIVPQDAVIFSSNARDNIRYGRPDATDEEVMTAAQAAHAHGFITALPQGYDTFLGERGVRLSGGQRQRIAIARAILKNPPLLLLDEATSALDAESERMVQAALESAMHNRTTLVIAHRLATVQKADRIVVIDQGRLVEQGTHAQLVALGGVYAGLAALQFQA